MGDRIAILKDGALVQYDTPEAILAAPANAFVEAFVGADRALKRLSLIPSSDAVDATAAPGAALTSIHGTESLRDALARMLSLGVDTLGVTSAEGQPMGVLTLAAIRARTHSAPH